MKRIKKIGLAVVVIALSLIFFTTVQAPKQQKAGPTLEYTQYYALVSDYFDERSDFSLDEIKKELQADKVVILSDNQEDLKNILGDSINKAEILKEEEINAKVKLNELAILPWDKITANWKTLSIEGKYLWDKSDLTDYPLKIKKKTYNQKEVDEALRPEKITKLISTGDVIMSRTVAVKMAELGVLAPWEKVKNKLAAADLTFISLEAPFSDRVPAPKEGMNFVVPTTAIAGLLESGVDVAGIANNHSTNFGLSVFADNLNLLRSNNILFTGGGNNLQEAETPVIIEKNGLKWAFLDWNSIIGAIAATEQTAGVAPLKIRPWFDTDSEEDIQHLEKIVAETSKKADVVVVQFHWGTEYKTQQSESQIKVAHRMIENGADLIVGTHPHAVQGSEYYHDKYITYSLGNFIFDQEWSQGTKEGSVLESYFYEDKNVADNLLPVLIENYHQPSFLSQTQGQSILDRVKSASIGF